MPYLLVIFLLLYCLVCRCAHAHTHTHSSDPSESRLHASGLKCTFSKNKDYSPIWLWYNNPIQKIEHWNNNFIFLKSILQFCQLLHSSTKFSPGSCEIIVMALSFNEEFLNLSFLTKMTALLKITGQLFYMIFHNLSLADSSSVYVFWAGKLY